MNKPAILIGFILAVFLAGSCYAQKNDRKDSYKKFKSRSSSQSSAPTLLKEANELKNNNPQEALNRVEEALGISLAQGDEFGEAKCYELLGEINERIQEWTLALENYSRAYPILVNGFASSLEFQRTLQGMGNTHLKLGHFEESLRYFQEALSLRSRSLQLSPNAMGGKARLGLQLMYLKRYEDALSVAKTELSDFWKLRALACIHWAMAEHAESDRDLAEFAKVDPGSLHSYFMANVHAFRGERDEAFKWLDRAYQEHSAYLPELNVDPILKSLRGDPRFRDLQVKSRLTD